MPGDRQLRRDGAAVGRAHRRPPPHTQGAHRCSTERGVQPDGGRLATASADQTARLWDARPINPLLDEEELSCRLWATRGDPFWHAEQLQTARKANDWYAALYHTNRLLEFRPGDA